MSVIKTERVEVCGRSYEKKMTYRSGGKFEIKVPAEIGEAVHATVVKGDTEKECDEVFDRVVLEFLSLRQKKDKVILYKVDLQATVNDADGRVLFDHHDFSDGRGSTIRFDFVVVNRFRVGDGVSYRNDAGEKVWMGGESTMDWTPEREAFFVGLQATLGAAVMRADEFFSKNAKQLAKAIDGGSVPLLLGRH